MPLNFLKTLQWLTTSAIIKAKSIWWPAEPSIFQKQTAYYTDLLFYTESHSGLIFCSLHTSSLFLSPQLCICLKDFSYLFTVFAFSSFGSHFKCPPLHRSPSLTTLGNSTSYSWSFITHYTTMSSLYIYQCHILVYIFNVFTTASFLPVWKPTEGRDYFDVTCNCVHSTTVPGTKYMINECC